MFTGFDRRGRGNRFEEEEVENDLGSAIDLGVLSSNRFGGFYSESDLGVFDWID